MKNFILLFLAFLLAGCDTTSNTVATQSLGMSKNKSHQEELVVINKEFAKWLIDTALAADSFEGLHQFLLNNLNKLDKAQLDQLTVIIKADRDSQAGEILPLDYIMPSRIALRICNYVDDRLGRLQYDVEVEGDMGPIDSVSTVQFYKFKPKTGHEFIVSVGISTVEEYNNATVFGHD